MLMIASSLFTQSPRKALYRFNRVGSTKDAEYRSYEAALRDTKPTVDTPCLPGTFAAHIAFTPRRPNP